MRAAVLIVLALAACGDDAAVQHGDGGVDAAAADAARADGGPGLVDASPDAARPECSIGGIPGTCGAAASCSQLATTGFCAGGQACCTTRTADGGVACDVTAHVLPNEGLTEEPGQGGCPPGMLRVTTFCIDRFEASLVKLDGTGWSPYFNPGATPVRAVSLRGAVPQGYIDEVRAAAACANAGKRMCTNTEWLRACQGPTGTTYPYGNTRKPGVCNDARSVHPAIQYFGTSASWIYTMLDNPCLDQLAYGLDRTGERIGCTTTEGAYDMMGNLHEWTSDPAGTFRGGFYVDTVINGPGCLYATTAHDVHQIDYSTGFRCCATP